MSTRIIRPKTSPPYGAPPPDPGAGIHWGYDMTQDNLLEPPNGYYPTAVNATAKAALASVPNAMVTCHIGGFGIYPPETANGVYDWGGEGRSVPNNGLDDGVGHVQGFTGASGIDAIILCSAPGWMKPSGLDFSMEEAPGARTPYTEAQNEQNFADLCADVVGRYTDVQWYPVWNEMKGLYLAPPTNRWNYEKYTRLYNLIWTATKAVRGTIKLGGPYVKFTSYNASIGAPDTTLGDPNVTFTGGKVDGRSLDVVTYFAANATGWDFIAFDAWAGNENIGSGGAPSLDDGITNLMALDKFVKSLQWIRTNIEPTKPIIVTEFYPVVGTISQTAAEDMLIDCFELVRDNVDVQDGIWFLQWGESVEPPKPFDYSTGNATGLIQKLIDWEAAQ